MNLSEFKAWFEGFTENVRGVPSKAQWARIQERVGEITSDPTPYPVFIDRYVQPYWRPYQTWWNPYGLGTTSSGLAMTSNTYGAGSFTSAGRAEALSISAST